MVIDKPHLIIVCGILYPKPSPTGLCAYRYASLLTDKYEVEFIAMSANGLEENVYYESIPTHTLSSKRLSLEFKTKGIIRRFIHFLGSAQLKVSMNGNLGWYAKSVLVKLEAIHKEKPIDALLTVCSPIQAHIAGAWFKKKHPQVHFCAYTVDPFAASDRIVPICRRFKDLVQFEKNVSNEADCMLLSEEAFLARNDIYGDLKRVMVLPYILPEINENDKIKLNDNKTSKEIIDCVYAGSFYTDIRNPEFMLKVFSLLSDKNIQIRLFSSGCNSIVDKFSSKYPNIKSIGYVSQKEIKEVYDECDFLISVGNKMKDFLPSKTYEYISRCKPIISFNPVGYENNVLSRYPYSLQIYDNEPIDEMAMKVYEFIQKEKHTRIDGDYIRQLYEKNSEDYVRNVLFNGLNNK